MAQTSIACPPPGPLARTAMELEHLRRLAVFRRGREIEWRRRIRETDLLHDLVEECRVRGIRLVPARVWIRLVRVVGAIDGDLRDRLGIDRGPDHVTAVLFAAQACLLQQRAADLERPPAPVIPLFAPRILDGERSTSEVEVVPDRATPAG